MLPREGTLLPKSPSVISYNFSSSPEVPSSFFILGRRPPYPGEGARAHKKKKKKTRDIAHANFSQTAGRVRGASGSTRFPIFFAAVLSRSPRARMGRQKHRAYRAVYCDCGTRRIRIACIKSCEYRRARSSFAGTPQDRIGWGSLEEERPARERARFRADEKFARKFAFRVRKFTSDPVAVDTCALRRIYSTFVKRTTRVFLNARTTSKLLFRPFESVQTAGPSAVECAKLTEKGGGGSLGREPFRQWV